jgi:hypothetical protein
MGFVLVFYTLAAHWALLIGLKRRGLYLPVLLWGHQLFFLQFEYLKGRRPYRSRGLDFLARSTLVAGPLGFVLLVLGVQLVFAGDEATREPTSKLMGS